MKRYSSKLEIPSSSIRTILSKSAFLIESHYIISTFLRMGSLMNLNGQLVAKSRYIKKNPYEMRSGGGFLNDPLAIKESFPMNPIILVIIS